MQNKYKKILTASILSILSIQIIYTAIEPSLAIAATANDNVIVTLVVDSGVTITTPTDATMSPNISMTAMKSIGEIPWTVTTNSTTGYNLTVRQSTATAMTSVNGDNFANYTEGTAGIPELWSAPASGAKEFGFSARGTNVVTGTWGTPTAGCGVAGAADVGLKYRGFAAAMTDIQVATTATPTLPAGTLTTVCFAAEQVGTYAKSGVYTATITATATIL